MTNPPICASKVTIAFLRREKASSRQTKCHWLSGKVFPPCQPAIRNSTPQNSVFFHEPWLSHGWGFNFMRSSHIQTVTLEEFGTWPQTIPEAAVLRGKLFFTAEVCNACVKTHAHHYPARNHENYIKRFGELLQNQTANLIQIMIFWLNAAPPKPLHTYFVCPPSHLYDGPFL